MLMATSAFKSTTKRSSVGGDDGGGAGAASNNNNNLNNKLRRSRSLSRAPSPPRKEKFVNTVRGSGFPEISLDRENLSPVKSKGERSRSAAPRRRSDVTSPASCSSSSWSAASQRRGRSVSRPHSSSSSSILVVNDGDESSSRGNINNKKKKASTSSNTTSSLSNSGVRRRSVSVARYQFSDSESEEHSQESNHLGNGKGFGGWNYRKPSVHKPVTSNHQRVLKRSMSQKDLSKSCDGYSSHSSALTDEEARDTSSSKNGNVRTIRAVYSQKKAECITGDGVEPGLYEVMRQELRHAVEDIRTEIEQGIMNVNPSVAVDDSLQSNNSDVLQAVSVIRKNYTAKLEQSEKRKQDLLAEIVAEEQRGRELSKIVKELLPDAKDTAVQEKTTLGRKNNDRSWMSKCLTEDAEKYFDDFLSNVEDTDISSFDGERSDASSTLGVKKPRDLVLHFGERESAGFSSRSTSLPVEMDGVALPWLQWETISDGSSLLHKSKAEVPLVPEDNSCDSAQGESVAYSGRDILTRSCASSSPGGGSQSMFSLEDTGKIFRDRGNYLGPSVFSEPRKPCFDMDEYLHIERSEEIIFEAWRQRQGISSGALILCRGSCLYF